MDKNRGSFIAFEGIDGSGKSTQIRRLHERMRDAGIASYTTMEPTASPIGSLIHQIMTGRIKTDNRVTAALFVADRLDHLLNDVDGILHQIDAGVTVLTDRYYLSSYAYQSVDIPMEQVIGANAQSSAILRPTLNIFIDISPDTAMERIQKNRSHRELFEKKSRLVQVREKYFEAFDRLKDVEKIAVIDGERDEQAVADDIWDVVREYVHAR